VQAIAINKNLKLHIVARSRQALHKKLWATILALHKTGFAQEASWLCTRSFGQPKTGFAQEALGGFAQEALGNHLMRALVVTECVLAGRLPQAAALARCGQVRRVRARERG